MASGWLFQFNSDASELKRIIGKSDSSAFADRMILSAFDVKRIYNAEID